LVSVDKNGHLDGKHEWYHENGKLSEKGTYRNGKLNGKYEYYENGKLTKKET
jgi:antitoxin component YwqK of YwqJK toxin-antitoxin module